MPPTDSRRSDASTSPRRTLGAVPALDGVRGAAILGVLANHWVFIVSGRELGPFKGGFLAVDLFLVLSGFLITSTLLREYDRTATIEFAQFAKRRLRRLLPPMALFFAVHAAVVAAIGDPLRNELTQAVLALTFTGNWQQTLGNRPPFDLVHLWSLALEGQMYLIWGAAVFLLRRHLSDPRGVVAGVIALVVAIAVWRSGWFVADVDLDALYVRTDTRADSILIGAIGAFVWRSGLMSTRWAGVGGVVALLASIVIWVTSVRDSLFTFSIGFTIVALLGLIIVWGVLEPGSPIATVMGAAPLRWTGKVSYSLYLWHLPIFVWSARALPDISDLARFAGAVVASFLAASLSYLLSERPFLKR
ncbi:MAG: acyltransferase [Actinobacteria bacterium]|nr:acyltransferase [Actinomycetota bacterium]